MQKLVYAQFMPKLRQTLTRQVIAKFRKTVGKSRSNNMLKPNEMIICNNNNNNKLQHKRVNYARAKMQIQKLFHK